MTHKQPSKEVLHVSAAQHLPIFMTSTASLAIRPWAVEKSALQTPLCCQVAHTRSTHFSCCRCLTALCPPQTALPAASRAAQGPAFFSTARIAAAAAAVAGCRLGSSSPRLLCVQEGRVGWQAAVVLPVGCFRVGFIQSCLCCCCLHLPVLPDRCNLL